MSAGRLLHKGVAKGGRAHLDIGVDTRTASNTGNAPDERRSAEKLIRTRFELPTANELCAMLGLPQVTS